MRSSKLLAVLCIAFLLVFAYGCGKGTQNTESADAETHEHGEAGEHTHERETEPHTHEGETESHTHEHGEAGEHTHEGEESGPQMGLDGAYDNVQNGIRLILSFDSSSFSFVGTAENVSEKTVKKVRVEVHLSNGTELGPTKTVDLAPGKKIEVKLPAEDQTFTWWKAYAETGSHEH